MSFGDGTSHVRSTTALARGALRLWRCVEVGYDHLGNRPDGRHLPRSSVAIVRNTDTSRELMMARALRRAGVSVADAELVLARQLVRLDDLIGERNRLTATQPSPMQGRVLGGRKW